MAGTTDAAQMLINLQATLPELYRLVTGAAYMIGVSFSVAALYQLKIYGELRTMMASQTGLKQPLTYLFVGCIFLFLPTGFSMVTASVFGYGSLLAYDQWPSSSGQPLSNLTITMLQVVQLIGIIAFVRGWIYIARSTQQSSQPGAFGKGLAHVIGGICAANIVGTVTVVANTFGLKF